MKEEIELLMAAGYGGDQLRKMNTLDLFLLAGKVLNDSTLSRLALKRGLPLDRLAILPEMTAGERTALRERCKS